MMPQRKTAERCPVCEGTGTFDFRDMVGDLIGAPCHGCEGKGWVVVPQPPVYDVINSQTTDRDRMWICRVRA